MRSLKFITAAIIVSSMFLSCENENNVPLEGDYLPLEVGNYWQLQYTEIREIVGTTTLDGEDYFLMKYYNDTSCYRVEDDKVYVQEYDNAEGVKFDLTADVDETWDFNLYTVTLISKTDTIEINGTEITNCFHFYLDVPEMADDEHSIWLAPGIGFVQESCGECLHPIMKLDSAKVGGELIEL